MRRIPRPVCPTDFSLVHLYAYTIVQMSLEIVKKIEQTGVFQDG